MKAFVVALATAQDGFLALADALAGKGANLTAVSLLPGDPPRLGCTVDLEDAARRALRGLRVPVAEYEGRNLANVATLMRLGSCDGSSRAEAAVCQA